MNHENTLFVSDSFDPETLESYTNYLINQNIVEHCICGWIDASVDNYEAFFYFVTPQQILALETHSATNINHLRSLDTKIHKNSPILIA